MHQKLIVYAPSGSEMTEQVLSVVDKAARAEEFDWCASLESFLKKFKATNQYSTALLLIEKQSDLGELVRFNDYFDGLRVILILPDLEEGTVALANRLFPRFVTCIHSDFRELSAVIRNILKYF